MLALDKRLTARQLYEMANDLDYEPILALIVKHEHAYPALQAWYEREYQATGLLGSIPLPPDEPHRGLFAVRGKLPSLQDVLDYEQSHDQHPVEGESDVFEQAERGSTALVPVAQADTDAESVADTAVDALSTDDWLQSREPFDEHVELGFDWRLVKRLAVIVGGLALVAALACGGVLFVRNQEAKSVTQARADCVASARSVEAAGRAFTTLAQAKTTQELAAFDKQNVTDTKLLTTLARARKPIESAPTACTADSARTLSDATSVNTDLAQRIDKHRRALADAIKRVQSAHRKQLDAQRGELQVAINGAQSLLDSSSGNVADNATRDSLKQAIDHATIVFHDTKITDAGTYITAGQTIIDAQNAVNASIDAKVKADEQAKQQAATDAQAPQSVPAPSPQYVTSPRSVTPSSPPSQQPTAPPSSGSAPQTWSVPDTTPNPLPQSDSSLR